MRQKKSIYLAFLLIIVAVFMTKGSVKSLKLIDDFNLNDTVIYIESLGDNGDVEEDWSSDGGSLFESAFSFDDDSRSGAYVPKTLHLGGYARGSLLGGGKQFDLANTFTEIALQPSFSQGVALLRGDIRLRSGVFFDERKDIIEIKELYAGYRGEKFDFFIGNQIVNWGRTDGFNPTNNITPNDYFFLTAEPDDQKMSNFLLRMKYRISPSVEVDFIGIPYFKASNYRFELFDITPDSDLDGLPIQLPDFNIDVNFSNLPILERKLENGSFGARINVELPEIDFSLSYFSGYDPYHGFDLLDFKMNLLDQQNPIEVSFSPQVYKKNTFGFDFALPLSSSMLRGEAAYNHTRRKNDEVFIPKSDFAYVLGLEKMWNDFVFIGQYIGKVVPDFEELNAPELDFTNIDFSNLDLSKLLGLASFPEEMVYYEVAYFNRMIFSQQKKFNHAFSFTVTRPFKYEEWNAEFTTYYNTTSKELMLRPKLSWKISDAMSFAFGASYMKGFDKSLFTYSSAVMNGVFAELKISF